MRIFILEIFFIVIAAAKIIVVFINRKIELIREQINDQSKLKN